MKIYSYDLKKAFTTPCTREQVNQALEVAVRSHAPCIHASLVSALRLLYGPAAAVSLPSPEPYTEGLRVTLKGFLDIYQPPKADLYPALQTQPQPGPESKPERLSDLLARALSLQDELNKVLNEMKEIWK